MPALGAAPVRAGAVFGFGLGGSADGIVLHQVLQWHHLVSDDEPTTSVDGLEANVLADGIFHVATTVVVVIGVVLLWRAASSPDGAGRSAVGGLLIGWGAFHLADEVAFHALLDLHHIRQVENYLPYDLAFTALGAVLVLAGRAVLARRTTG